MVKALVVLAVVGYVAVLPVFLWHRHDLMSFRHMLWAGYGSRDARLHGAAVCYAALGWPELLMALSWRSSKTREALVRDRDDMRESHAHRCGEPDAS